MKKEQWRREEDLLLLQRVEEWGKKWSAISKLFKGRTEHMVKNRFHSLMRKWSAGSAVLSEGQIIRKMTRYWLKQMEGKRKKSTEIEVK